MSFTCRKCGETAYSKCPNERSVFPKDQNASILRMLTRIRTTKIEGTEGMFKVELIAPKIVADSPEDAEEQLIKWFRGASEETIKHYLCEHDWKGRCEFGHNH